LFPDNQYHGKRGFWEPSSRPKALESNGQLCRTTSNACHPQEAEFSARRGFPSKDLCNSPTAYKRPVADPRVLSHERGCPTRRGFRRVGTTDLKVPSSPPSPGCADECSFDFRRHIYTIAGGPHLSKTATGGEANFRVITGTSARQCLEPDTACTKCHPFGVPSPVAGSQPGPVGSVESRPNVMTNQRVENGLL
jgi:hypothetical protein